MPLHTHPDARVILHGHFYQPPRENPWTEAVPVEPGAGAYHDWNERITAEAYRPNTAARVLDPAGRIQAIVNNFEFLSFDVGPTLFAWLERHHPEIAGRILAADHASVAALGGHGNAIAQAYNHAILPLCNDRDRKTQIHWGLREFLHRFRRPSAGMWLPETAVDADTVEALIDAGVRFTVLAPYQAWRIRPLAGGDWVDVGEGRVDARRPYRIRSSRPNPDGSERSLDVFFYDGPISRAVSFEHLLRNSDDLAGRLALAVQPADAAPQAIAVAVDGETFGHHEPFGDMCIAAFATLKARARGLQFTNFAAFLDACPPTHEVELQAGPGGEGTAWSCAHGVGRWRRDCGCAMGAASGWNQGWRAPLRAALDTLRDAAARVFEARGARLFHDPWAARDEAIDLVLRPDDATLAEEFFSRHLRVAADHASRVEARTLLESQRHAMAMYTSCGWFFDDLGGIETIQNLRYAARVAQLLQPLTTEDLEAQLRSDLAAAHSNVDGASGATLFDARVRPDVHTPRRTAATFAFLRFLDAGPAERTLHGLAVRESEAEITQVEGARARRGHVWLRDRRTGAEHECSYLVLEAAPRVLECYVTEADAESHRRIGVHIAALTLVREASARKRDLTALFEAAPFGIADLPAAERATVAARLAAARTAGLRQGYREIWLASRTFLEDFATMHLEVPTEIRLPCEFTLQADLDEALARLQPPFASEMLNEVAHQVQAAQGLGLRLDLGTVATVLAAHLHEAMRALLHDRDPEHCAGAERLLVLAERLTLPLRRAAAEELLYAAVQRFVVPRRQHPRAPAERVLSEAILHLAARMGFDTTAWDMGTAEAPETPAALSG